MIVTKGAFKGLLTQARRAAQKRAQKLSTGHVLLVMLQEHGDAGAILVALRLRESDLLSALKIEVDEPASALEVVVERAQKIARALGHASPSSLHLLLALTREPRSAAHRCLERTGCAVARVHDEVIRALGVGSDAPSRKSSPELVRPDRASKSAPRPLLAPGARSARAPLPPRASSPEIVKPEVDLATNRATPEPPIARPQRESAPSERPSSAGDTLARDSLTLDPAEYPLLTALGRNLSAAAAMGNIEPLVGREHEIEQILDVLARRRANNPILVGPPGVGKTAIVEALATSLLAESAGGTQKSARVLVEIAAPSLIAGTAVRGALAERMRALRSEIERAKGRVVLFIDEIHMLVSLSEGPEDVASDMKAALARGELSCIGATTEAEYARCFERDSALARRFTPIHVSEPSPKDALEIVRGVAPRYEAHHGVRYLPAAFDAAVDLSVRYIHERCLPDKAIALLDTAAARVQRRGGSVVDVDSVAAVVAERARVPVERLLMNDARKWLDFERLLAARVVGHSHALERIAHVLRKSAAGFRSTRPLGTFLLLGPTGVGKTETAKAISEIVFSSAMMTRFDMSELSEAHSVARLVGAPPGYVGHEDGGQLTEAVRRRPYQLVLLDEIDKAHPDVLLALLPLLDEARLTDGRGRVVDFSHTIVVMTSNFGAEAAWKRNVGFGATAHAHESADETNRAIDAARGALLPELWNRIDEVLYFGVLTREEVAEIARRMLGNVQAMLAARRISLEIDMDVVDALIAAGGYDAKLGARPLRRTIGRMVEGPLASAVLSGEIRAGDIVRLTGTCSIVRVSSDGSSALANEPIATFA